MKKELIVIIVFIFLASMSAVSAQFFGYNITFSDIARNEMVNAALLFLLIFALSLFVLRDIFKRSYGAAIIIALVVGAIGALATISFYGPIIPLLAPWMIVIAVAVIALILWRFLSGFAGIIWILAAIALLWLFVTRRRVCGVGALFPYEACIIIDFIAIAILIIAAFNLFYKMFAGWRALPPPAGIPGAELFMLEIRAEGNGTTRPAPGHHRYKQNSRVRVVARPAPGAAFDHWELDGTNMGRNPTIVVVMNIDHTLVAYFAGGPPITAQITANPTRVQRGQPVKISWKTRNTYTVEITPTLGKVPPVGSRTLIPTQTTVYRLIASNRAGMTATREVKVEVQAIPALPPPLKALPPPPSVSALRAEIERLWKELKTTIRARNNFIAMSKRPFTPKPQRFYYQQEAAKLKIKINELREKIRTLKAQLRRA